MQYPPPYRPPQGVLGAAYRRPRSRWAISLRVVGTVAVIGAGAMLFTALVPQGPSAATVVDVRITEEAVHDPAPLLIASGVLRYPRTFRIVHAIRGSDVQPGDYMLSPHLSVWSLARVLTTTRPRPERTMTIIEGWNLRDIAAYLEREGIAPADAFTRVAGAAAADYRSVPADAPRPMDFRLEFAFLAEKPDFIGLEGYLFPDTYRVYADASAEDIVRKMLTNFDRKLTPELRAEITQSGRSLHQIVTMASIVEAEISATADRPIAAGILWKRRDRGMLLQVDATVNYVTGKHDPSVSRLDTAADSAYNTYRYPGLPRGPINSPGMDAMLAALRPKPSPYWFFLTAKDGRTVFARTLEEHQANIERFLR